MSNTINTVITKNDRRGFIKLPSKIYKDDSFWIPQVEQDVESIFEPFKNKYFNHGECERWILRNESNEVIGQIAAFINKKKAHTFDQPTGGLGFFECINDIIASNQLFDTAIKWLKKRN